MLRGILNAVPLSVLLLAAVALTLAVVLLAVWVIRRTVPETREGFHAEISAPMLGVVAALFGLLLAFVIIIAYENFLEASADVSREADALASIVRDSAAFSEPEGDRVRGAVGKYVHSVVEDEWPLMRDGDDSSETANALDGVFDAMQTVEPESAGATGFFDDSVRQLNDALDTRRDRLEAARGGLPFEWRGRSSSAPGDRRVRRPRRISALLVPRARPRRDRNRRRVLAGGASRSQLPLLGQRLRRPRSIRDRCTGPVLRAEVTACQRPLGWNACGRAAWGVTDAAPHASPMCPRTARRICDLRGELLVGPGDVLRRWKRGRSCSSLRPIMAGLRKTLKKSRSGSAA